MHRSAKGSVAATVVLVSLVGAFFFVAVTNYLRPPFSKLADTSLDSLTLNRHVRAEKEQEDIGCLNEEGVVVDWWVVYKMPGGFQYAYRDSSSSATTVLSVNSAKYMNSSDCAVGRTLQQLHKHQSSLAHMLWNTDFPAAYSYTEDCSWDCVFNTGGHSKGVLASSASKGFWLIHSVPKFPDLAAPGFTWEADTFEGQSFLCLSVPASVVEKIAKNLQYSHVHTYAWGIPSFLKPHFPNMRDTSMGKRADGTGILSINLGDTQFKTFSKSPSWNNDLYSALVQPNLAVSM
jgi:deoxyribonuclease-2